MRAIRIGFAVLSLGGLLTLGASAFTPVDWCFSQWPYTYSDRQSTWFYLNQTDRMYCYDFTQGQWIPLSESVAVTGWAYFQWPFCYALSADRWLYMDINATQYCCNLQSGTWSLLGRLPPSAHLGWTVGGNANGFGTILHTGDGGASWVRQGASGVVADVAFSSVSAMDRNTAWVAGGADGGYGAIYRTTDGGANWIRQGSTGDVPDVEFLRIFALDSNHVWATGSKATALSSSNGGATWAAHPVPVADTNNSAFQGVFAVDPNHVWITGFTTTDPQIPLIYHTTNGGLSWVQQAPGDWQNASHILSVYATDENTAWAVGGFGYQVFHTVNGGITWTNQHRSAPFDANDIVAVTPSNLWVAGDSYIFASSDAGQTWTDQYSTAQYTVGIAAKDTQFIWAVQTGGILYKSCNGGRTWDVYRDPQYRSLGKIAIIEAGP